MQFILRLEECTFNLKEKLKKINSESLFLKFS